jgi:nitrate reductase assembly molybdenum cofactor insertion protein NarJ
MTFEVVLRESAQWRLLGRLFECPDDRWREEIAALAGELDDSELAAAVAAARVEATEGQYHSVFGPGGPAPPREATYHDTLELGSLMSELALYYESFGYAPRVNEPPDHVAVEIGFVAFLKLKEAYALAIADHDHAERASLAAAQFVRDHLAMMAVPLATVLAASPLEYLAIASRVLAGRVGPPPSTRFRVLQPRPDDDEAGSEFPCGP